jgi:hypothetical protein
MKNFKNYIINLDKKKLFLIQGFLLIIMIISNFKTEQKLINGYQFLFFFFSLLPIDILLVIIMLRGIFELEGPPKHPFHFMKYPAYCMIIFFGSSPFIIIWAMRDVISHLKW